MVGGGTSTLRCPQNRRISGPSGTGNIWIRLREIRLFGCRWCGAAERISMEILVVELHHRGAKWYITLPSRRSNTPSSGAFFRSYSGMNRMGNHPASSYHQGSSRSALSTASSSNVLAYPRVKPKCFAVSSNERGTSSSPNPKR